MACSRAHFYLHVDPQPLHRSVDFTGAAIPDRPTFSVNEVCYSCGDYEGCEVNEELGEGRWSCIPRYTDRYGEDDRALMQRPVTYVPFLVRVFDKAATDAERQAARSRGEQAPEPVYQWVYRPEMQFSLFDLQLDHLYRTDEEGTRLDVLSTFSPLRSSDGAVELIYSLLQDELPQLETFGPARELVFQLGERQEEAILYTDPTTDATSVVFRNFDAVAD